MIALLKRIFAWVRSRKVELGLGVRVTVAAITANSDGKAGAANRTRTCDPVITNDVLYQLSYCGELESFFGRVFLTRTGTHFARKRFRAARSGTG